jgi:hypothetical protein
MASVSTTVYTCDRNGVVSEPTTTGMPPGWSTLNVTTMPEPPPPPPPPEVQAAVEGGPPVPRPRPATFMSPMPVMASMLLCPACTAELTAFRNYGKS